MSQPARPRWSLNTIKRQLRALVFRKTRMVILLIAVAVQLGQAMSQSLGVPRSVESGLCDTHVRPFGYSCREYRTITSDGFVLNLQRIQRTAGAGTAGRRLLQVAGEMAPAGRRPPAAPRRQPPPIRAPPNATVAAVVANATQALVPNATATPPPAPSTPLAPVLLSHAVFMGSGLWFGGELSWAVKKGKLPFVLARAGFDVWIGNHRGTQWSPDHAMLSRTQAVSQGTSIYSTSTFSNQFCY
eukprot:SM000320S12013  [mRNA]  locus=s320:76174:77715:- [translate_table: standard]